MVVPMPTLPVEAIVTNFAPAPFMKSNRSPLLAPLTPPARMVNLLSELALAGKKSIEEEDVEPVDLTVKVAEAEATVRIPTGDVGPIPVLPVVPAIVNLIALLLLVSSMLSDPPFREVIW